jgi:hypothetical protein
MSLFLSFADQQPSDADELRALESAEHIGTADPVGEKRQWLGIFGVERAAECFWVASKGFQSNVAIRGGIGWR